MLVSQNQPGTILVATSKDAQKSPNLIVVMVACTSTNCGHLYSASALWCLSLAINEKRREVAVNPPFFTLFQKKDQICFKESSVEHLISRPLEVKETIAADDGSRRELHCY